MFSSKLSKCLFLLIIDPSSGSLSTFSFYVHVSSLSFYMFLIIYLKTLQCFFMFLLSSFLYVNSFILLPSDLLIKFCTLYHIAQIVYTLTHRLESCTYTHFFQHSIIEQIGLNIWFDLFQKHQMFGPVSTDKHLNIWTEKSNLIDKIYGFVCNFLSKFKNTVTTTCNGIYERTGPLACLSLSSVKLVNKVR